DSPVPAEPLEQIHELNRLFLRSLQTRKMDGLSSAGFPAVALAALRRAGGEQLDAIAEFPRALFELVIDPPPNGESSTPHGSVDVASFASRILELTIAYCAWSASRESPYHARLFFGLGPDVIRMLRATPV